VTATTQSIDDDDGKFIALTLTLKFSCLNFFNMWPRFVLKGSPSDEEEKNLLFLTSRWAAEDREFF
jgi:hypothetical protein